KGSVYAVSGRQNPYKTSGFGDRRGIIQNSALCVLCRHRHKGHWTKHPKRLDREFGRKKWGDEGYAREELVAELGAAFLCADLELTPEPGEDHAAYIQSWLKVLKNDKRAIFSAAAHAQRAADYLHSLQPNEQAFQAVA
ncbi:MAG: zincin-like metallopeptidase domain-containing protein, partial [Donghicola eburneus]